MFVSNIVVGEVILERKFFDDIKSARNYVSDKVKEKVWHLGNHGCYYGNVNGHIYEIDKVAQSCDQIDSPLFSY